jgi:hypothetical protein
MSAPLKNWVYCKAMSADSDRESGHRQTLMSALAPKADMCGATSDDLLRARSGHTNTSRD